MASISDRNITYPKTLSNSVRRQLSSEIYPNEEALYKRLDRDPRLLLVFFAQVSQSIQWNDRNHSFALRLFVNITDKAIKTILPWNDVLKVLGDIFKYMPEEADTLVDFGIEEKNKVSFYSRFVLMRASPVLKRLWMNNPDKKSEKLSQLARYLESLEELSVFYHSFLTNYFGHFYEVPSPNLQRFLCQAREWEYERGVDELQRILCTRMVDYSTVLGEYAFAYHLNFPILRDYCKKFLDEVEFYISKSVSNFVSYTFFKLYVPKVEQFDYSRSDLILFAQSYLSAPRKTNVKELVLERFDILFTNESTALVGMRMMTDQISQCGVFLELQKAEKSRFEARKIEKLISDGTSRTIDTSVIGMLVYFDNIVALDLFKYNTVEVIFLQRIAEVKPNLQSLCLVDCTNVNEAILLTIATRFSQLVTLHITKSNVSKNALTHILKIPNLVGLALPYCQIDLPDDLSGFAKIADLILTGVSNLTYAELQNIFEASYNLVALSVIELSIFNLGQYPYPHILRELSIDCTQLEKWVTENKTIPALTRYKNLMMLSLYGKPSVKLKAALEIIIKSERVQVIFMKPQT